MARFGLPLLSLLCLLTFSRAQLQDTLVPGQSLTDGQSIISARGSFHLGFYRPRNSSSRYLGIWYGPRVPRQTIVWVANRGAPISDTRGVLNFTARGILVLFDGGRNNGENTTIWSSNVTRKPAVNLSVELLDSGNLVVKDGNSTVSGNFLWQSFDYPCDTLLPGMKIGKNFVTGKDTILTSWKSDDDPREGQFSLLVDPRGFPQLVVRDGGVNHYRLGSWNGNQFTGTPMLRPNPLLKYEFVLNALEVYYMFEVNSSSLLSRLLMNQSGFVERSAVYPEQITWRSLFSAPLDDCDNYAHCGAHETCNLMAGAPTCLCSCLDGFRPKSPEDWNLTKWSAGCVRKTPLSCNRNDGFLKYGGMKVPDTSSSLYIRSIHLSECEGLCLNNCSCTAYASSEISNRESGCLLWFGDLADIRGSADSGQDLYVKVAASEFAHCTEKYRRSNGKKRVKIIVIPISVVGFILILLSICVILRIQRRRRAPSPEETDEEEDEEDDEERMNGGSSRDLELPLFQFATIVDATNNFSPNNKLGQGGYGPVYKGILKNGRTIAVKRLSKRSRQGTHEFKNEVVCIAKLQHRNLVKLLGCCIQSDERVLIYEYMPNKSLNFFIFDKRQSVLLDWPKRLHIINGIARGLLYLHQDSRLRIIHRDMKASNVLLDDEMNPKISDFGMARSFAGDESSANTKRIVGTYGYMSPEYAIDGLFSIKSDVFSFGVLVLEIISGKKNRGFSHTDHKLNLLGHAWMLHKEGRSHELADECIKDTCSNLAEVERAVHIGLMCVQQSPEDRPNMSSLVVMLSSEIELAQPKEPGFFTERDILEATSSMSKHEYSSSNKLSETLIDAR
ncbi:G-type lectin S-receptor-like serine/threonine-protein kinase At4g27290 [Linum grandiflorum]